MEWGIAINLREPITEIIEKAIVADQGGIDTVWITDYPATRFSPIIASEVAKNTKNCRIGVGLLSPLIYSPLHILQIMNTLVEMHGNRFDLLLGPGDRTKLGDIGVDYGNISTLVERMKESVITIRERLVKENELRVFMGAQGPRMIEASIYAHGVLLNYSDPQMIDWAISLLDAKNKEFTIGVFPPALIGSSKSCSEHMGIKTSAAVIALGLSPSIIKQFGLVDALQPIIAYVKKHGIIDEYAINSIEQRVLDRFCICSGIEESCNYSRKLQELGVQMIVFGPPQGASSKGVERLANAKKLCDGD